LPPLASGLTVPRGQVQEFVDNGRSVLLTDDHAPVEQLIAPVFAQALQGQR
jgi:predicted ABC-class ATPase